MAAIDFLDIATLLNFSRSTQIKLEPISNRDGRWSLHQGLHKIHTSSYPFHVLYLRSSATVEDIRAALKETAKFQDRHLVYPSSLEKAIKSSELTRQLESLKGVWSAREYLTSYIREELQAYLTKLHEQAPHDYIDPRINTPSEIPRKIPNPVLSFLRDPPSEFISGKLGIVLAEPGQGKTYMSRHLVDRLIEGDGNVVPLMVDSSQWQTLPLEDQRSLFKTIAHSFRHFGAAIGWVDGHEDEFLRAALKADLFRIVFDGFDEYILRNLGVVQPMEVLDALADLAASTGTRIVITSRTSFWETNLPPEEVDRFLSERGAILFKILPFDLEHAKNYFGKKLHQEAAKQAERLYQNLKFKDPSLVGRGFVLSLIADLAAGQEASPTGIEVHQPLSWLAEALCERETLRQQLPFTAQDQMNIFRTFAVEVAEGAAPVTELLELCVSDRCTTLDKPTMGESIDKLKSHPLIERNPVRDLWAFRQEQIQVLLLAEQTVEWTPQRIKLFVNKASMDPALWQDLAAMIVDMLVIGERDTVATDRIYSIVEAMTVPIKQTLSGVSNEGSKLAGIVALTAVERLVPKGNSKLERAQRLAYICGRTAVADITFTGVIAGYDFDQAVFQRCRFEKVTWANCKFSESTKFIECQFIGAAPPIYCEGFGRATLDACHLDPEAEAIRNSEKIKEGYRRYSSDDLRSDMRAFINRFIVKGGFGLKTVESASLVRGVFSASPHRDEIMEVLKLSVIEDHRLTNSATGFHIRPEAVESVKFYATNSVFTGRLREAFERLKTRLDLD